ncbi:hypothetical protein DPX16_3060 [Anabarilius grahami]|uniref:Uncharacterized protein n=1 Tax=Anabarilius grahami TaxID=495550 RepID=A0A3N0XIZ7_ANAGA|nr:hypothetical protein DPX16_3060 [Anabarilius grahami]
MLLKVDWTEQHNTLVAVVGGVSTHDWEEERVLQMDVKVENILKILMENFQPKPELLPKPNQYSSRVTVMKRLGVSMDESQ